MPFAALTSQGASAIKSLADKYDCQFIDSLKYTKYEGKGDGIHYGGKDATAWGQSVVQEMKQKIVTVKPAETMAPKAETKTAPVDAVR